MSYLLLLALFMLPIMYEGSPVFRYHFKIVLYYVLLTFQAIVMIPVFILRGKRDARNLT